MKISTTNIKIPGLETDGTSSKVTPVKVITDPVLITTEVLKSQPQLLVTQQQLEANIANNFAATLEVIKSGSQLTLSLQSKNGECLGESYTFYEDVQGNLCSVSLDETTNSLVFSFERGESFSYNLQPLVEWLGKNIETSGSISNTLTFEHGLSFDEETNTLRLDTSVIDYEAGEGVEIDPETRTIGKCLKTVRFPKI